MEDRDELFGRLTSSQAARISIEREPAGKCRTDSNKKNEKLRERLRMESRQYFEQQSFVSKLSSQLPSRLAENLIFKEANLDLRAANSDFSVDFSKRHLYFVADIVAKSLVHLRHDKARWPSAKKILAKMGQVAVVHLFGAMYDLAEPGQSNVFELLSQMPRSVVRQQLVAAICKKTKTVRKALPEGMTQDDILEYVRWKAAMIAIRPPHDMKLGYWIAERLWKEHGANEAMVFTLRNLGFYEGTAYRLLDTLETRNRAYALEVLKSYELNDNLRNMLFYKLLEGEKPRDMIIEILEHYARRNAADAEKILWYCEKINSVVREPNLRDLASIAKTRMKENEVLSQQAAGSQLKVNAPERSALKRNL